MPRLIRSFFKAPSVSLYYRLVSKSKLDAARAAQVNLEKVNPEKQSETAIALSFRLLCCLWTMIP